MRKSVASPSASSSAESIPPADSSGSNTDTSSSPDRNVENGIDIFKMANLSDAIPGHFYSYKTGNPHYVRQVFSSLHDLALALYLEYYPLVQFYQRGDANKTCAAREGIATPLGTPFPISYVWKNAVHTYYPDYVGKLIDGRLLIAEAGVAEEKRSFEEERRRTKILPRFWSEHSGLKLIFGVVWRASARWPRVHITSLERKQLELLQAQLGLVSEATPARTSTAAQEASA
jgi:hypothetical protein